MTKRFCVFSLTSYFLLLTSCPRSLSTVCRLLSTDPHLLLAPCFPALFKWTAHLC